ncbi:unnamed protein product [Mytilus edulis]|uniref:Uncharacterized protein n=1 Tax=Mytilus edulis TaxID=6550 RepID=A0A8S3UG20_MYTED|nr:unnamed protein product [Mytilus edulis]
MTEAEYSEEKLVVHSEHSTSKLLLKQYKMNENGERFLGVFVKTVKGARVPLEPQPNPTEVLVLKRAYTKLQRLPEYQRRISWVVTSPESPASGNGVAFVEYIGIFPTTTSLHGNNKNGHGDYIRTNAQIVDDIKGMVKTQNCREIYTDLALDDSMEAPRDLKQIQNFKYNEKKRERPHQQKASNNADDIQTLMSMQHGHPFIKEIVQLSGKPPSVVVYTDEQLLDLKKFCSSESKHIIGVDRTFNFGAAYVTVTVFHNQNLIRKVSNTPAPIMLGPCNSTGTVASTLTTDF